MNIEAAKISLAQKILSLQKESIIKKINQLLEAESSSIDDLDISLEKASKDKKTGRVKAHNEVKVKYKKWL